MDSLQELYSTVESNRGKMNAFFFFMGPGRSVPTFFGGRRALFFQSVASFFQSAVLLYMQYMYMQCGAHGMVGTCSGRHSGVLTLVCSGVLGRRVRTLTLAGSSLVWACTRVRAFDGCPVRGTARGCGPNGPVASHSPGKRRESPRGVFACCGT